jgi:hypothetical protein
MPKHFGLRKQALLPEAKTYSIAAGSERRSRIYVNTISVMHVSEKPRTLSAHDAIHLTQ